MLVTESGQFNITTKPDSPEEDADKVTAFIAAEQAAKGEIRLEMNFTPVMAHRYSAELWVTLRACRCHVL